jgi:demethylmenaquinone methyltransferase/2-methoxy-6-polyprenyl-1,4-benzoquinol methylase
MNESFQIKAMFDSIARRYDFLNHLLSLGQDYYWRYAMLKELMPLKKNSIICDLATGTGDSALVLTRRGFNVIGVDLSLDMLKIAKKKHIKGKFFPINGSAYTLPFKDETFDAITCAFGIRNMHVTKVALKEVFRVIKRGGKVVFLEFSLPEGFFLKVYRLYMKFFVPNLARVFSKKDAYEYLWDSIYKFPKPDVFEDMLLEAGFHSVSQKGLSFGTVYIHKAFKL